MARALISINGLPRNERTFAYDATQNQAFTFVNEYREWSINVLKTDHLHGKGLEGATFALYSPNSEDQMTATTSADLTITANATTYYLAALATTGKDGTALLSQNWYIGILICARS